MKKLILIVLALTLVGGVAFAGYDEGAYINNKEGSKGSPADPVRVYQLVRYAEMAASSRPLTGGEGVCWDTVSDDGVTIALRSKAGSRDAVAGVTVGRIPTSEGGGTAAQEIGKSNWGYIQTYGYCPKAMVLATVAAGQAIFLSETDSYLGPCLLGSIVAATTPTVPQGIGFAYDAVSSNAQDVEVFLRLR